MRRSEKIEVLLAVKAELVCRYTPTTTMTLESALTAWTPWHTRDCPGLAKEVFDSDAKFIRDVVIVFLRCTVERLMDEQDGETQLSFVQKVEQ